MLCQSLWQLLQDTEQSQALWLRLERAASIAAISVLPPASVSIRRVCWPGVASPDASPVVGAQRACHAAAPALQKVTTPRAALHPSARQVRFVRRTIGLSDAFQIASVRVQVAQDLRVDVHSVVVVPPLPSGGAPPHHAQQSPDGWHGGMLGRVVAEALNLTGASLHRERRWSFSQLHAQLKRVLKARGAQSRRQRLKQRRPANRGRMDPKGGRGGGNRGKGASGRTAGRVAGRDAPRDDDPAGECDFSMMFNLSELSSRGGLLAGDAPSLTGAAALEERCIEKSDLEALAQSDTEWFWRRGFRRVVPGSAAELRSTLRPARCSAGAERAPKPCQSLAKAAHPSRTPLPHAHTGG
mgnify:CR=1 FL=1